ncbi:phosphatase PAP2 family protein [Paracidovorax wautersii]|uniref:Membrane-associated PAP2 superfamily phosphatase n=1 Tax=Paracidovorax wautersii TaxID=1177982 RepID=A0ABU1IDS7_9BURK|nr:phosphatase PAP2 family protein [Paracidovorax wautersii]MDR6215374.1 membrane-associated PAP2 superfamily phosphatase [Paracidovorax wautersii]
MPVRSLWRLCAVTVCLFLAAALWDATALDLPLARLSGDGAGFAWRSHPAVVRWLHEVPRHLSTLGVLALIAGVWWPWGFLRSMARADRLQLVGSILAAMGAVIVAKRLSATSCPWDLAEFGGMARYVSHWSWGTYDGGPGHCFPGGHASAAFAYLAGWCVVRRTQPGLSGRWLAGALAAGLVLGVAQQVRGAHYMSHTFWSAWICWTTGLAVEAAVTAWRRGRAGGGALLRDTKLNEA